MFVWRFHIIVLSLHPAMHQEWLMKPTRSTSGRLLLKGRKNLPIISISLAYRVLLTRARQGIIIS